MSLILDTEYHIYDEHGKPYGHTYNWNQAVRLKRAYERLWPGTEFEIRKVTY